MVMGLVGKFCARAPRGSAPAAATARAVRAATWLVKLTERGVFTPVERDQIIPLRTLKTRIERDQPLTVEESDRLFRSAHITAMAEAVFGEADKAKRWLSKPKERFSGLTPMQMLTTQQGTTQVEEMLLQVAEGFGL